MKKGFTLIELLGIIVILGLIVAFTVPSLINLKKNEEQKEYDNFLKNVSLAAETFYQTNTKMCDFDNYTYCYINVSDLIENDYLRNDLINPKNKNVISHLDTVILEKNEDNTIKYYYSSMNEYVQNNLLVHYDGINNIITKHDNSTNVWKTTKGNLDGNINGATWNNNSLMFDGNSYVSIDQINTQNITYEAVFNSTEPSEYVPLIANVEGGGCTLSTRHSPYRAYGQCYINGQYRTLNTSTLEDNKDYLVTMTFDGTTLKLYLNGSFITEYVDSTNSGISYPISDTIVMLGANPVGNKPQCCYYSGKIYSVRIYDRALSESEVKQNYEVDKSRYNL